MLLMGILLLLPSDAGVEYGLILISMLSPPLGMGRRGVIVRGRGGANPYSW
jgi:hypothetical protein